MSSSPILKNSSSIPPLPMSSSPIFKGSSPVLKSNSPTTNSLPPPPSTSTSFNADHPISTNRPSHFKRPFQYTLYPDQLELEDDGNHDSFPAKRSKTLLTTFTCRRTHESAVYFTQRMLELSRVSRRTLAAQMEYQRLRAEELRLIRSIMEDEAEESKAYLNRTDIQVGSLRNDLFDAGVAVIGSNGRESHDAKKEVRCGKMHAADDSSECDDSVFANSDVQIGPPKAYTNAPFDAANQPPLDPSIFTSAPSSTASGKQKAIEDDSSTVSHVHPSHSTKSRDSGKSPCLLMPLVIQQMGSNLLDLNSTFERATNAFEVNTSNTIARSADPIPLRRQKAVLQLQNEDLEDHQLLNILNKFQSDIAIVDIYLGIEKPTLRKLFLEQHSK